MRQSGQTDSIAYWAASGNSMPLSATTTSFASLRGLSIGSNNTIALPPTLRNSLKIAQRFPAPRGEKENTPVLLSGTGTTTGGDTTDAERDRVKMPPPAPAAGALRRSKSMGGLRTQVHGKELARRAKMAGYCENCRDRFSDLAGHIKTRRHVRFANESANFASLDVELLRVARVRKTA
jgi:regulatory subunit for Cdc7p protein kinase